jgi:hypothetical protein
MSVEVSSVVWKHAPVDASAMIVLLVLADFADADGGCWPGVKLIADRARCSTRTAQRQLESLSGLGFVRIAYKQGPNSVNRYFVNVEAILAASRTRKIASQAVENQPQKGSENAENLPVNGPNFTAWGGDNLSPPAGNEVVTSATQVVTPVTGGGDTGVTQYTIEPPIEPPLEREREGARAVLEERQVESQEAKPSKTETGKAALEKRVQRFCSGAGFKTGAWPDWDTGASFGYVAGRFEALSEAERETAERWRDAYLADVARRGKAAVKVGNFLRDRMWEALDPRLLTAFEAAPVAGAPAQTDGYAPAFGPVWGAWVVARLLSGQEVAGLAFKPDMPAEVRKAWPLLGGLFSEAKCGRGRAFGQKPHDLAALLEPVPVGSAKWDAWMTVWQERGWPVLPETGNQKVVYLPRGLDVLDALLGFAAAAKAWQPSVEKSKTMENAA